MRSGCQRTIGTTVLDHVGTYGWKIEARLPGCKGTIQEGGFPNAGFCCNDCFGIVAWLEKAPANRNVGEVTINSCPCGATVGTYPNMRYTIVGKAGHQVLIR